MCDFHIYITYLSYLLFSRVRLPHSRRQSRTEDDDEFFDSLQEMPATGVLKPLDGELCQLHHPTQALNVPITQDPVPLTEDIAREQQEILAKYCNTQAGQNADEMEYLDWVSLPNRRYYGNKSKAHPCSPT